MSDQNSVALNTLRSWQVATPMPTLITLVPADFAMGFVQSVARAVKGS